MIIEMKWEQTEFVNEHKKDALQNEVTNKEFILYFIYRIRPVAAGLRRAR